MIKTGDWTIADLIKYLVAVHSTLTPTEMDRLRHTAAFPKESLTDEVVSDQATKPRFKASDLYEPLDVFRQLNLPVIDWGIDAKWRPYSEEGMPSFHFIKRRLRHAFSKVFVFAGLETVSTIACYPQISLRPR